MILSCDEKLKLIKRDVEYIKNKALDDYERLNDYERRDATPTVYHAAKKVLRVLDAEGV